MHILRGSDLLGSTAASQWRGVNRLPVACRLWIPAATANRIKVNFGRWRRQHVSRFSEPGHGAAARFPPHPNKDIGPRVAEVQPSDHFSAAGEEPGRVEKVCGPQIFFASARCWRMAQRGDVASADGVDRSNNLPRSPFAASFIRTKQRVLIHDCQNRAASRIRWAIDGAVGSGGDLPAATCRQASTSPP